MNIDKEREVLKILFARYLNLLQALEPNDWDVPSEECSISRLSKLAQEAIENGHQYPTDKMHRWLGFIQGVLTVKGVITVDEEREWTRPLLHSYLAVPAPTFSSDDVK